MDWAAPTKVLIFYLTNSKRFLFFVTTIFFLLGNHSVTAQTNNEDVSSGEFRLHSDNGQVDSALLKETSFSVVVSGMQGRVTLRQRFENTSSEWVEGEYLFPLPTDSAVDEMVMIIGERRIVGKIREKEQAKKIYQEAKNAGKKASLVSQHRENLFRSKVANIAPGETIEVELKYLQTLHYDQGRFSMRFPTTLTPRYIPGKLLSHFTNDEADSTETEIEKKVRPVNISSSTNGGWILPGSQAPTDQVPDAHLITSPMIPSEAAAPLYFEAEINAGFPLATIESLYHPVTISNTANAYQVQLDDGAKLNKDLVLRWTPEVGTAPQGALFVQQGLSLYNDDGEVVTNKNDEYFLSFMLLPPQDFDTQNILPKETIFVIDTSGSMAGNSIRQAKRALIQGLNQLNPQDRFNIIEFNSRARSLWSQAKSAQNINFEEGERFINSLQANGGTEMASALSLALANDAPEGYIRQVIFMTDGSVGNEEALFKQIETTRGSSRIFTVGIGSAPNSFFMQRAAEVGQGSFTYIGALEDIQESMMELFYKLDRPMLSDIQVDFSGFEVEMFPKKLPDLYAGEPLMFAAKIEGQLPPNLVVSGKTKFDLFLQQISLQNPMFTSDIDSLWARKKIHFLSDQMRHQRGEQASQSQQAITQIALRHRLMSKFTSFIAVEETPSRALQEQLAKRIVPNAMPEGNTMQYPIAATALGLNKLYLIAVIAFLMLLLLNRNLVATSFNRQMKIFTSY